MPATLRSVVQEHHAYYEVSPHYVLLDERPVGLEPVTKRIQNGFDVDIYGSNKENRLIVPGCDSDYEVGCRELLKAVEAVSRHTTDRCAIQVLKFADAAVLNLRDHSVEALIRIRIHHHRGVDQPFGQPEENALGELETELKELGIRRR